MILTSIFRIFLQKCLKYYIKPLTISFPVCILLENTPLPAESLQTPELWNRWHREKEIIEIS